MAILVALVREVRKSLFEIGHFSTRGWYTSSSRPGMLLVIDQRAEIVRVAGTKLLINAAFGLALMASRNSSHGFPYLVLPDRWRLELEV